MSDPKAIPTSMKLTEQEHLHMALTLSSLARKIEVDGNIFLGDPELTARERMALSGELSRLSRYHSSINAPTEAEVQAWLNEGTEPQ